MAAGHLVRRFFGSLHPGGPRAADTTWAEAQLLVGEVGIWREMSGPDRRHAVGVARRVDRAMEEAAPDLPDRRPVLAAALLHDAGKVDAGLGTYGRVVATLSGAAVRRDPDIVAAWTRTRGFTRRVGLYLQHPRLGSERLALAGSDPLTVAWAREHHLPEDQWSIDLDLARILKEADDD